MMRIVLTFLLPWTVSAFFILGGVINVVAPGSTQAEYRRWGYPDWFHFVTGTLEFATAICLIFVASRLAGAGLGCAIMLSAAATVIVHGEYHRAAPPIVVFVLSTVVAWTAM
jgi:hypothetical protein